MSDEKSPQTPDIDPTIARILGELAEVAHNSAAGQEIAQLEESLDLANRQLIQLRLEDEGWNLLTGGKPDGEDGPTLDQIKQMSDLIRAAVAESPLPKQANNLRASYAFSGAFIIPGVEGSVDIPGKRGPKGAAVKGQEALKSFVSSRTSREFVFGKSAQTLISTACSTDGVYLLLGDDKTKEVHALSVASITNVMVNPDHPGEVWAYQRTWNPTPHEKKSKPLVKWYYTDRFTGKRPSSHGEGAGKVEVDTNKTILDLAVNTQTGWALGVPDLWAGHVWNRNYLAALKDGMEVSSLMAWLSARVKKQSRTGSDALGVKVTGASRGAGVQTYGEGNAIDTYATTGKAYDYEALNPIAAVYALAAGVSLVDLLSSPSASGGSYGAAQSLSPGLRRANEMRRDLIASWMERVLEWGTGSYVQVTPASTEEIEPSREAEILALMHNSGLYHADEIRPRMAHVGRVTLKHDGPPKGYLKPNNEESLPRKDIDPEGTPNDKTSSATQGKSTGAGGKTSTDKNDRQKDAQTDI